MKTEAVVGLLWRARVSRVLIFTVLCCSFVGLGWFQPNAADAETLSAPASAVSATSPRNATAAYVVMQRVEVNSVTGGANDGLVTLSSLTLNNIGTADVSAARVYLSTTATTTLPADAVQIGRTPMGGILSAATVTTIVLSSGTTTQRSVITGTPAYVYILYDMLSTQATRTAQSRVTGIGVASPDTGVTGLTYSSNIITLNAGTKATITLCTECHSNPPLDGPRSAATGSFLGSHNKHATSLSYACAACHSGGALTTTNMAHRNSYINMSNPLQYGGNYSKSGATFSFAQVSNPTMGNCSTIYCHSRGITPYVSNVTPTWGGAAMSADCSSCHGGNSSAAFVMGGVHVNHFNSSLVGRTLNCLDCHYATVTSTTDRTIATPANHVTGSLNVKFNDTANINRNSDNPTYSGLTTTVANGAGVTPGTFGVCNNLYCHSSGNLSGTNPATNTLVAVGTVSWKQPQWNATTIGCSGCHGDGAVSYPNYATGSAGSTTANSHVKHVVSSNLGCAYCHVGTVGTNTTTAPTSMPSNTWHLNRVEDVAFMVNGGLTGVYNADKSCSTTYCHGTSSPSPSWGGTTNCASCHNAATNLSTGVTDTRNRHWQHLETATTATNFLATNRTVAGSYDFNCGVCHFNQPHAQGYASPGVAAQVAFSIPWSIGSTTGSYSAGSTTNILDSRNWAYSFSGTCTAIYCHSNGAPLGSAVFTGVSVSWGKTLAAAPNDCSVCHGGMSNSTAGLGPIATNRHPQHISTALGYNYSCAECHAGTTTTGTTITNKLNHVDGTKDVTWLPGGKNSDGAAYVSPNCSSIYCHSNGTRNATPYTSRVTPSWNGGVLDCAGCHGNSVATLTTGAHAKHLNTSTWLAGVISCEDCHNATASSNTVLTSYANHVNKFVTINLSAQSSGATATYSGSIVGGASVTQKTPGSAAGTCNTTYCHGGNSQIWTAVNNDATCVKCHGVAGATPAQYAANTDLAAPGYVSTSPAGTGVNTSGSFGVITGGVSNDSKVGAHDAHNRGYGGYKPGGTACTECHNVTALNSAGHMNGSTTFSWGALATNSGALTPTYSTATGNCSTNYCHGGAFGAGVVGTSPTVSWTNGAYLANPASPPISADCNKCHLSPPTSTLKFDHAGITVGAGNCNACHEHDGAGATHINGILYGAGTCDTCHSYDLDAAGDWGRKQYAVEGWGAHAIHISHLKTLSGATLSAATNTFGSAAYNMVCGVCHTTQTAQHSMGNTTNVRSINFGDGSSVYSFASGTPIYSGTTGSTSLQKAKTCSNVSCHFQVTPVWQGY